MSFSETTIGNIPNTLPAITDNTLFESEFNPGTGPVGYQTNGLAFFLYLASKYSYGDGINFTTPILSVDADLNNFKFDLGVLNTIQDISVSASPTFETMTLTSTSAGFTMPRMTTNQFNGIPTPNNGLIAWSQTSNRFRVNAGQPNAADYKELAYTDDQPTNVAAFGEVYFQNNTVETVISTPGVFVKVDAVYNPGDLFNFTNGSGLLTYTGIETQEFSLNLSLTTTLNLAASDISVVLYKNGVAIGKSEQTSFTGSTTPGLQNGSVNALIELSTNDYIEIYITNNGSTDNILVHDLNLTVNSIGGGAGDTGDQVVVSWDNSTNQVDVVAGTDISITNGVISYTGAAPVTGPNGNFQLWEMTSPTLPAEYTLGQYLSITNSSQGDKFINRNQLEIGEQAIMEFTFELVPVNISTVTQISGGPLAPMSMSWLR
jgi:hypothetical protein